MSSVYEQLEDGDWFASIPGFDGLWVTDPTIQAAEAELRDTMNEHDKPPKDEKAVLDTLREEIAGGLRYTHTRANANTRKLLEIASFAYAAIDLLAEKGLLQIEELDERKKTIAGRLVEKFIDQGMGITHQEKEQDKYTFEAVQIDCESRLHLCKAACCKLGFALSKQDVEEGVVKWNFARPYFIAQAADGYCIHMDRCKLNCTIHAHRPVPCRGYDCRKDKRIWENFEEKIVSPELPKLLEGSAGVGVEDSHEAEEVR